MAFCAVCARGFGLPGSVRRGVCWDQFRQPVRHWAVSRPADVEIAGLRIHRKSQGDIPDREVSGFGRGTAAGYRKDRIGPLSGMLINSVRHLPVCFWRNDTLLSKDSVEIAQPQLPDRGHSGGRSHVIPPGKRIADSNRLYTTMAHRDRCTF